MIKRSSGDLAPIATQSEVCAVFMVSGPLSSSAAVFFVSPLTLVVFFVVVFLRWEEGGG